MNTPKTPFEVPDGYFEKLENDIFAKTSLSHQIIFGAKEIPFVLPENFFEKLEDNIFAQTSVPHKQVFDVLPKNPQTPFQTPNAYFEQLQHQILSKISPQKPTIFWQFFERISIGFNSHFFTPKKIAFATFSICILGAIFWININPKNNTLSKTNIKNDNLPKNIKSEILIDTLQINPLKNNKNNSENTLNLLAENTSKNVIIKKESMPKSQENNPKINDSQREISLDTRLQDISKQDLEAYLAGEEFTDHDILEIITQEQSVMMMEQIILGHEEYEEELKHKKELQKEKEINELLHEIHELAE